MAEGILRSLAPSFEIHSAGTRPELMVNPNAIEVMKEIGIDITSHRPKSADLFIGEYFDYVITVCDHAREQCPLFTGTVRHRIHIGFEDPADARGTRDEVLAKYRDIRDQIAARFGELYRTRIAPEEK
jgi:arsenate reductase